MAHYQIKIFPMAFGLDASADNRWHTEAILRVDGNRMLSEKKQRFQGVRPDILIALARSPNPDWDYVGVLPSNMGISRTTSHFSEKN